MRDANESEITKLKEENEKLKKSRDVLSRACEFYGDKNNWLRDKEGWRHDMIEKDLDDETLTDWNGRFSGKKAREALKADDEIMKGE